VSHVRALIGLALLVGAALGGLEHVTQQNPSWFPVPGSSATSLTAGDVDATTQLAANMAKLPSSAVFETVAMSDSTSTASMVAAPPTPTDAMVAPVKRVAPVTPTGDASVSAIAKTGAVVAGFVAAKAIAAKVIAPKAGKSVGSAAAPVKVAEGRSSPTFTGKSSLGGPPVTGLAASAVKSTGAKVAPGASAARPGFKLTCTSAQKLDEAKHRCVSLKGSQVATAKKPKA
jgi:hypothetical protein